MTREAGRVVKSCTCEHLLIDRGGAPFRLDIIEGTVLTGPVSLHFDVPDTSGLHQKLTAIRAFTGVTTIFQPHLQMTGRLHALHAADARAAGASLREIAHSLLGDGTWPGDGEHRKSLVRRMIAAGEQLVRAGPRAVLARGGGRERP